MNRREKTLVASVGILALLFIGIFVIKGICAPALKKLDNTLAGLREKVGQIKDERRAYFSEEDYLKGLASRLFGRDTDTATAQAGKMLTDEIVRLGLQESRFSRQPVPPHKLRGAQEVGWSVQGEGPLARMVDLLFVLEQTPQVHHIENLVISAGDRPGRVRARFYYLTLVIDIAAGDGVKADLKPQFTLQSPRRRLYDPIVQRDFLRPYIPGQPAEARSASASSASGPRPEMLKVVSLSDWADTPEVHVCDLNTMKISIFKPGDTLGGGEVVAIDYRAMPLASKPEVLSYSRVILKIGANYWAVDQGQTLATKYQLTPEQLPTELR
jgi:hypothetical protein